MTTSQLWNTLNQISKKFTFQLEEGKEGFRHYQGVFSLYNKEYFSTVKNMLDNTIHLEKCLNYYSSVNYCSKSESRIEGPWNKKKKPLKKIKIWGWQLKIVKLLDQEPNDRTINWIYDEHGKNGKTSLAKWLLVNRNACYVTNGKTADIAYSIDDCDIVIFDFSRSLENHVNYGALEQVKNGLLFSAKYKSCLKIFNPPHVLVLANFYPEVEKLSKDRWNIITLDDDYKDNQLKLEELM